MAYKQHNSPFNNNLKGSFTNPNTRNKSTGKLQYPETILNETADGTSVEETTGEDDTNTDKGMNDDMIDTIDNANRVEEDLKKATDWRKNKQARRKNKRMNRQLVRKLERGERKGELSDEAKETLEEARNRKDFMKNTSGKAKTAADFEGDFQQAMKTRKEDLENMEDMYDIPDMPYQKTDEEEYDRGDFEDSTPLAMYKINNMDNKELKYGEKHLRSKGGAFPMVAAETQANPYAEPVNRAGRGPESNQLTNDPNIMQPTNKIANSTFNTNQKFSDIASSAGTPHTPGTMMPEHKAGFNPAYGQPAKELTPDQEQKLNPGLKAAIKAYDGPGMHHAEGPASFKGLVSKLEKQGKSKEAATKIAGKVANAKLKGAGSGPTAAQKARSKGTSMHSMDHAHTKITKGNVKSAEKDDAAHIDYLKQDINYDAKHGGSKKQMTDDEKHISKLAGDLKYDNYTKRKYDNTNSALSFKMSAPYKQVKYSHSFSDSPMNMGPFEETDIVPNTKTVAQDQSSIDSVKKRKKGVIVKGTGSMGEKIKMKSKHKRNKTKLSGKF